VEVMNVVVLIVGHVMHVKNVWMMNKINLKGGVKMINLNVNNNINIEISQERADGKINVNVLDSNGEVDYFYEISSGDMVMLLNYYQSQKDSSNEIF